MYANPVERQPTNLFDKYYLRTKKMTSRQCWFALSVVVLVLSTITIVLTQKVDLFKHAKMKLVVDTDVGSDDAMALFYLLRAEKHAKLDNKTDGPEVLAVTCVNGNTAVDHVVVNVLKVLQAVNRIDIPVYRGADSSILTTPPVSPFFGEDGMGDIPVSNPPTPDLAQLEHAVNALIRLVDENPGEITLLALGPLTNIALAIRLDDNFLKKLRKLIIFGGSVEGRGNVLPGVEFNFYVDPEANYIVFNGTEYRENSIMILPWEAVLSTEITMEWRKDVFADLESPEVIFLNKIEHIENYPDEGLWIMGDPILAAMTLNETLITKKESYSVTAVTQGTMRGGLAVDYTNILNSKKKIDIVYKIDTEGYKTGLLHHFS
ncbi:nucleoside hydrolase-like [Arctopsyche grandis]|uniref:nucleoside hydrolase-like n=1 Tax=Arctopsyche grandis TaxID=121162 RepID=UPI00406D9A65